MPNGGNFSKAREGRYGVQRVTLLLARPVVRVTANGIGVLEAVQPAVRCYRSFVTARWILLRSDLRTRSFKM